MPVPRGARGSCSDGLWARADAGRLGDTSDIGA